MNHFKIVKESDVPVDMLPVPSIWVPSIKLKERFEQVKQPIVSDINRPIVLQVRRGDRYELRRRFQRITEEKPRIGEFNFANASEIDKIMLDPYADPTVMLDGDRFPYHAQARFVRQLKENPLIALRLIVLTEKDPGELLEEGSWSEEFRMAFYRTYCWPSLMERDRADTVRILMEFLKGLQRDLRDKEKFTLKIQKGGVEFFAEMLHAFEPESVHRLKNAATKLVRDLLADGFAEITGASVRDIMLQPGGWEEAVKQTPTPEFTSHENITA